MVEVIKTKSKDTYTNNKGVECHYYNYWIKCPNGQKIQIKCAFPKDDAKRLDMVATYVK